MVDRLKKSPFPVLCQAGVGSALMGVLVFFTLSLGLGLPAPPHTGLKERLLGKQP